MTSNAHMEQRNHLPYMCVISANVSSDNFICQFLKKVRNLEQSSKQKDETMENKQHVEGELTKEKMAISN